MAENFDKALKSLIDAHAGDWAAFMAARLGVASGPASSVNVDLSASLFADRILEIDSPEPWALHVELQASHELGMPERLLRYYVATRHACGVPVRSVLALLRRGASASDQVGLLELRGPDGRIDLTFRYDIWRVWEQPVDRLLGAGPGLAPLALVSDEAASDVKAVTGRIRDSVVASGASPKAVNDLMGLAFSLGGLRYNRSELVPIFEETLMGVLEHSDTVKWAVEKGEAIGELRLAREMVLELGTKHLGPPSAPTEPGLDAIDDVRRLKRRPDALPT